MEPTAYLDTSEKAELMTMTQEDAEIQFESSGRTTKFKGRLLARVSSERSHASRWTEMELYRTVRGLYIVRRIGASKVFHTSDCVLAATNRLPYGHELPGGTPSRELLASKVPCSDCRPLLTDPIEQLRFERERHWSAVAESPESTIDLMYRSDGGQRILPWIAVNLLNEACIQDGELAQAFATERV